MAGLKGRTISSDDLVGYAGAAGHEGLSMSASGDAIIKPCTQAEVAFYESVQNSDQHARFRAHMPVYMGTLQLNRDPTVQQVVNQLAQGDGIVNPELAHSVVDRVNSTKSKSGGVTGGAGGPDERLKASTWTPSGGKKLQTGLAIVLENAASGFHRPNVLDLKLGARLWDDDAPAAKRQKLDDVSKTTTSSTLGFRVAGMKVNIQPQNYDPSDIAQAKSFAETCVNDKEPHTRMEDGYKCFEKTYGRALTPATVNDAFVRLLGGHTDPTTQTPVGDRSRSHFTLLFQRLLAEIQSVKFVLESEESRMYSASVLVIAESDDRALTNALDLEARGADRLPADSREQKTTADPTYSDANVVAGGDDVDHDEDGNDEDEDDADEMPQPKVLEVRLIDFAHARFTPGQGPDENALQGVRSIEAILATLIKSLHASSDSSA